MTSDLLSAMDEPLKAHQLNLDNEVIRLRFMLEIKPETEQFVGDHSDTFDVPELV